MLVKLKPNVRFTNLFVALEQNLLDLNSQEYYSIQITLLLYILICIHSLLDNQNLSKISADIYTLINKPFPQSRNNLNFSNSEINFFFSASFSDAFLASFSNFFFLCYCCLCIFFYVCLFLSIIIFYNFPWSTRFSL